MKLHGRKILRPSNSMIYIFLYIYIYYRTEVRREGRRRERVGLLDEFGGKSFEAIVTCRRFFENYLFAIYLRGAKLHVCYSLSIFVFLSPFYGARS